MGLRYRSGFSNLNLNLQKITNYFTLFNTIRHQQKKTAIMQNGKKLLELLIAKKNCSTPKAKTLTMQPTITTS
jgi:hypothetical protein